eukprot:GHVT01094743.1.p1 GENE.GHVT01094743.1~~GHVT01094743.1.p1  ORF type:complete len:361 (-),score=33.72 GHVT01094743.1:1421-2503(-)
MAKHCPFTTAAEMAAFITGSNVDLVDLCFSDPLGLWNHCTFAPSEVDEKGLRNGLAFDGSSIRLFRSIVCSDMVMVPDPTTCWIDPFQDAVVLHATCTVRDPDGNVYAHCPRSICQKASKYATETGVADHIFFGPEAEFFVFDDVKFAVKPNKVSFEINGNEAHWNNDETPVVSGRPSHNLAHRVSTNSSYFPVAPLDQGTNLRNDMLLTMADIGIPIEKHHHEVATCQHELGFQFRDMLQSADIMMSYKYVVKNVARKHGKTATFMPKPISGANGSGMHCHMSLWKEGKNLFFDKNGDYAKLSKTALYYIGGLIRHAPAVLAFSNSTVNSYKRLVPGFEAPVNLAFSTVGGIRNAKRSK